MKKIIIALAVLVALLILGFIGRMTGGSFGAFFAGAFLLAFLTLFVASAAGITSLHPFVKTVFGIASVLCLILILWAGTSHQWSQWKQRKEEAKAAKTANTPPPVTRTITVVKKVRSEPVDYYFTKSSTGCFYKFLERTADIVILKDPNATTGVATMDVTFPKGGGTHVFELGVAQTVGGVYSKDEPYIFCKRPDSIGIGFRITQ